MKTLVINHDKNYTQQEAIEFSQMFSIRLKKQDNNGGVSVLFFTDDDPLLMIFVHNLALAGVEYRVQ